MSTEFQHSEGHVHTGTGDQLNVTFQMSERVRRVTRRGAGPWSEAEFEDMSARFSPPEGFHKIWEGIEELRIVVLNGSPGSGRRFAAFQLLRKTEYSRGLFYAPVIGSGEGEVSLADLKPESGDRLLVDLSTTNAEYFDGIVAHDVQPFFKLVRDAEARSVVILPDGCELQPELQRYVRKLNPPDAVKAYRKHLRSIGVEAVDGLDEAGIREHFRHAPIRDLDRLTRLVEEARDANPTLDHRAWTNAALDALRAGRDEVAAILKDLKAGQQRALLLSASLFAGGSADEAWRAAVLLLDTLRYPKNPDHPLDQSDLQEQLAAFGARIDQLRRLQFQKPLDGAIRAYLWDGYPGLRATLAKWMNSLIKGWKGPPENATVVVERFGEQHLRTRQANAITGLIADLANSGADIPVAQAFVLLKQGLEHPEHGHHFRRQTWEWAKNPLSDGLGEVLIRACVEVMSGTYPNQALVRLHHLARKPGRTGEIACEALAAQLDEGRLRRLVVLLLARMSDYPNSRDPHVFVRVIDPFRLTDSGGRPRPLIADAAVRAHLTFAWRAALHAQPEGWRPRLDTWLGAATVPRRDVLLSILAKAPDDLDTRSLLYAAAAEWAATRGGAWKTVEDLLNRINTAQGISFVAMERSDR